MQKDGRVKILLVDDEQNILDFLEMGLVQEGFQVKTAQDGMTAINIANQYNPNIVILDVMMPGMDGFEVCRILRRKQETAIIMLTAKDEVDDRVKGLNLGADDYMLKPFSFEELIARVHARIRNQFPDLLPEVRIGPFHINDGRKEILYNCQVLKLSSTEYKLLKFILHNQGLVLSKNVILDRVWGYDFDGNTNVIDQYIGSLRNKLNDKEHRLIHTVRGAGYRLDLPNGN